MNIVIIILVALITPFVFAFFLGAIKASILGSDKRRRAKALVALSQMTEEQIIALEEIFIAYKANAIEKANRVSEHVSSETINYLIDFFDYNHRPDEYSSGTVGKYFWIIFEDKLKKLGYSEIVSKIITGVVMDNYNEVLEKMVDKNSQEKKSKKELSARKREKLSLMKALVDNLNRNVREGNNPL